MRRLLLCLGLLLAFSVSLIMAPPAMAQTPTPNAPPGFRPIDSAEGVTLYQKDYPNGSPDFVQVIRLDLGARLALLHGDLTEARPSKGSFGGPDPRMTSPAISTYWRRQQAQFPTAFCVTNGGFFYMPEYPTRLPFPLKVNGEMITEGWGIETYIGEHLMLELWAERADIQPMTRASLYASDAPNILGGLSEAANKRAKFAVGRTFVGLVDGDGDETFETLLLLTTRTATQAGAAAALREFGAAKVMMLDGGGSTQLLCASGQYIQSDRPIPQAVAVIAAVPPPVRTELLAFNRWPVLIAGQGYPLNMTIRNTGVVSWTHSSAQLMIKPSPISMPYLLPVEDDITPQHAAVFSDTLDAYTQPGVYRVKVAWGISYQGDIYHGQNLETGAVVLPVDLAERQSELQSALDSWQAQSDADIRHNLEEWMQQHLKTPIPLQETPEGIHPTPQTAALIHIEDAIWIPLLMLPIVVLLGFMFAWRDRE